MATGGSPEPVYTPDQLNKEDKEMKDILLAHGEILKRLEQCLISQSPGTSGLSISGASSTQMDQKRPSSIEEGTSFHKRRRIDESEAGSNQEAGPSHKLQRSRVSEDEEADKTGDVLRSALSINYSSTLTALKPLPWDDRFCLDLDRIFTNLVLKGRLADMKKIVLLVRLREVLPGESIAEIVWDQCVTKSAKGISISAIETCLQDNESKLVFLLDGYDELVPNAKGPRQAVPELLAKRWYPNSTVIVTSRPLSGIEKYMVVGGKVEVAGFSSADVDGFTGTYFQTIGKSDLAAPLIKALQANIVARNLIQTPMFIMLICVLWEDDPDRVFPGTMSGLYQELLTCVIRKHCVREEVSASRLHPREQLNFPHKTMQEFLAGRYVADTVNTSSGDLHELVPLDTMEVLQQSTLIYFICGCGGLTRSSLQPLRQILPKLAMLEELNLSFTRDICEDEITLLLTGLVSNLNLTDLELQRVGLGDVSMKSLTGLMHHLSCLKYLDLSNNNIRDGGLEALATTLHHAPCMEVLKLQDNPVTEVGIKGFVQTICIMPAQKHMYLGSKQTVNLDDTAAMSITSMLTRLPMLECLHLLNISMSTAGFQALTAAMEEHTTLRALGYAEHLIPEGVDTNKMGTKITFRLFRPIGDGTWSEPLHLPTYDITDLFNEVLNAHSGT
ncbi:hypothetical protein Bbelb_181440 [Branchiostoma belcheri]|nr:hypothetical protein Bbelb_181440 [Branchiostoma belcheri]